MAFENPIGPEDREQWLRDKIEERKRQISELKAGPQSVAEEATVLGQELAALSRSIQAHAVPSHLEPALVSMRQMLGLAAACHKLRDELSAEAYLCHDDMPLLASHLLAAAHAGDLLWDVPEIPDRYGRFGRNDQSWPRSALDLMNGITAQIAREARFAMCTGQGLADFVSGRFGIPAHAVESFRPVVARNDRLPDLKTRLGLAPEQTLLVYLNTVTADCGMSVIFQSLAALSPKVHLAFLSTFSPGYRETLESNAGNLSIQNLLHFLSPVPHDKVPEHIAGADAALVSVDPRIPNAYLSFHNRYVDAIAAGLPVIGTANRSQRVWADRGYQFAIQYDFFSAASLVRVIEALPDIRAAATHQAHRLATGTGPGAHYTENLFRMLFDRYRGKRLCFISVKDMAKHYRSQMIISHLAALGVRVTAAFPFRMATDVSAMRVPCINLEGGL